MRNGTNPDFAIDDIFDFHNDFILEPDGDFTSLFDIFKFIRFLNTQGFLDQSTDFTEIRSNTLNEIISFITERTDLLFLNKFSDLKGALEGN